MGSFSFRRFVVEQFRFLLEQTCLCLSWSFHTHTLLIKRTADLSTPVEMTNLFVLEQSSQRRRPKRFFFIEKGSLVSGAKMGT